MTDVPQAGWLSSPSAGKCSGREGAPCCQRLFELDADVQLPVVIAAVCLCILHRLRQETPTYLRGQEDEAWSHSVY